MWEEVGGGYEKDNVEIEWDNGGTEKELPLGSITIVTVVLTDTAHAKAQGTLSTCLSPLQSAFVDIETGTDTTAILR